MKEEQIVMIAMSGVFTLVAILMMASPGFVAWGLRTRTGEKWVRMFGEQRTATILRFIVPPFLIVISAICVWAVMTGQA